jgi:hypothetical protein
VQKLQPVVLRRRDGEVEIIERDAAKGIAGSVGD